MNPSPFHYARALFRAARGLPLPVCQPPVAELPTHRREPPRLGIFRGIMETAPPTAPGPEPTRRAPTKVAGFLQLEVDSQKKATGRFLLFSDGRVLAGTVEGAACGALGRRVETSFRVPPSVVSKLRAGQTAPVAVRCLRFPGCDH